MAFLGKLKRSEAVRFFLTLDSAPTGTPTVTIEKNGTSILTATNMTQGSSSLEWYHDYTTGSGADAGSYQVRYTAVIDGTTRYGFDYYEMTISEIDDVIGTGAYNATINVKDDTPANVADAYVTIHNSNDDDEPVIARGTTDYQGNVTLNIDGSVYVRVKKAGFNFASTNVNVTASGTYNVTGTTLTYQVPADPELCRLYIYPITLDNQDVTDLSINISSKEKLTKLNGEFINNASLNFTYDNTTTPDSYYFDAVQGAIVHINCDLVGIDHEVTVPLVSAKDLNDLIS